MSNKIFKNYQVNVGNPFQIRPPVNFHTLNNTSFDDVEDDEYVNNEENGSVRSEIPEEILIKAKEEANLIVQEARLEALRLMENSEREIEESRNAIEEEARRNGYEDGYNEAKKQCEDILQEAEFVREHARSEYNEVLASIESDAVNIILGITKNVIAEEININKDNILLLVKQAFDKCSNKENVVLKVSGEDYDFIMENKDKLHRMVEGIGALDIKKDVSLKCGACLIETPFGSIDAGVQTKLKKIEEAFRSVIGK